MTREEAIEAAKVLKALIGYAEVTKILGTFIVAFKEKSVKKEDGNYYLHGNFNLTGTVSGRQASNSPNLTNLPSGSTYGKLVKECFKSHEGKVMIGADFNALEARVSALLTRDPNKIKVYTEGYDSHSVNAYGYFPKSFPTISQVDTTEGIKTFCVIQGDKEHYVKEPELVSFGSDCTVKEISNQEFNVKQINRIPDEYPAIRQKSKTITFAAQYGGTYLTFMDNGFTREEAIEIERNYHELYKVADAWVHNRMVQATKDGYVTLAFGLRLRTPILEQSILTIANVPHEAKAEARSAGNATQQCYGMLNSRAAIEMQQRVWESPYIYDILPTCAIHDSQYFSVSNKAECIEWFNNNLIECMSWDGLPEIQHETVKISATAEIFYPSWAESTKLPNRSTKEEIIAIGKAIYTKQQEKLKEHEH